MPNVHLTIATMDYDHVRDFREGRVAASGIDATWLDLGLHEMFARFLANREWDVSELSFAKFIAEATRPDSDIIGLPVFLRREFRFGIIYVNRARGIRAPADLRGKRIGVPEWAQTATVYTRGLPGTRFRRAAHRSRMGAGRHQREGARREGRDGAAARRPHHPHRRQELERMLDPAKSTP